MGTSLKSGGVPASSPRLVSPSMSSMPGTSEDQILSIADYRLIEVRCWNTTPSTGLTVYAYKVSHVMQRYNRDKISDDTTLNSFAPYLNDKEESHEEIGFIDIRYPDSRLRTTETPVVEEPLIIEEPSCCCGIRCKLSG